MIKKTLIFLVLFFVLSSGCVEENIESNLESELTFTGSIDCPSSCSSGQYLTITGNVSGGTPPYEFQWDLDGDGVFDDGNGRTLSIYLSSETLEGNKDIYLKIIDADGDEIIEEEDYFVLNEDTTKNTNENNAPETPTAPIGQTIGYISTQYCFSQNITDPDNNLVSCKFDWGDGTYSEWTGLMESGTLFSECHTWSKEGTYEIKIQAKDEYGDASNWSDALEISIIDEENAIVYPKIVNCYNILNDKETDINPLLGISVTNWFVNEDYDGDIPTIFIKFYLKDDVWIEKYSENIGPHEIKSYDEDASQIGDYDCKYTYQLNDADEFSKKYWWKASLEDEEGNIIDEKLFSFTTFENDAPYVDNDINGCQWTCTPTYTVKIRDTHDDRMDIEWYLKREDGNYEMVHKDYGLVNGGYSYTFEGADECSTDYCWYVKVIDEHGLYTLRDESCFDTGSCN